jgi:putative transposase
MPHHEHEVEVFDARTGEHLGAAFLADQASPEQIAQVHRARAARRRQLQADLRAAEKARRIRYAAATAALPPRPVTAVTAAQAAAELADADGATLRAEARPGLMLPGPPAPGWVLPRAPVRPPAALAEPGTPAEPGVADPADGLAEGRPR